jgi:hypothetical protein
VAYIEAELAQCLENRFLKLGDPTLIPEIQDALVTSFNGMFLWVALQIRTLCTMQTDEDITKTPANLPTNLSETYSQVLRRSQIQGKSEFYQRDILKIIASAKEPLTVKDMQGALSVVLGDTNWTTRKLLNDVIATIGSCGRVLVVDEEELTVRFVQASEQDFLLTCYKASSSGLSYDTAIG